MRFTEKVALVTGAAVGIGRACALQFATEGATVVLLDVNADALHALEAELSPYAGRVLSRICNVADEAAVLDAVADGVAHFGKVDILVNNAALWRDVRPLMDISAADFRRYFDVNVMGTVHCTRAVLPGMLQRHYGRIVNVASVAGIYGNRNMCHYSATKGAVIALTRALAKEVTPYGVLVNAVSPGSVSSSADPDQDSRQETALSYMGRTGTDRENAALIAFLASDQATYIAGQNIPIDGCRRML